jgi:polysaccharide biosynthesis protein VpsM
MKSLSLARLIGAASSATLAASLSAAPFMAVGDNAALYLIGGAAVSFNDNIYLQQNDTESDVIFNLSPGVELAFGGGAAFNGTLTFREDFYRYLDNSEQNTSRSNAFLDASYSGARTSGSVYASLEQMTQNSRDIRGAGILVDRTVYRAGVDSEYAYSQKTSLGLGFAYYRTDFKTPGFRDSVSWSIPLDVYYRYSPKMDWSVGYRYRNTEIRSGGGSDARDHFFNVGARGQFSPKLTGNVRVGVDYRDFRVGGNDSTLGVNASLAYAFSPKVSFSGVANRDFNTSGLGGQSFERTGLGVRANYRISEFWSAAAGVNLERAEYQLGRRDNYYVTDVGLNYSPAAFVTMSAGYTFRSNNSNINGLDFDNNVLSLSASFRY